MEVENMKSHATLLTTGSILSIMCNLAAFICLILSSIFNFSDGILVALSLISFASMFIYLFCSLFSDSKIQQPKKLRGVMVWLLILSSMSLLLFSDTIHVYSIVPYLMGLYAVLFLATLILMAVYSKGKRWRTFFVVASILPAGHLSTIAYLAFALDYPELMIPYISGFIAVFIAFSFVDYISFRRESSDKTGSRV